MVECGFMPFWPLPGSNDRIFFVFVLADVAQLPFAQLTVFNALGQKLGFCFFAEVRFSLCFGAFVDFRVVVVWGFSFCCPYKEDL